MGCTPVQSNNLGMQTRRGDVGMRALGEPGYSRTGRLEPNRLGEATSMQ